MSAGGTNKAKVQAAPRHQLQKTSTSSRQGETHHNLIPLKFGPESQGGCDHNSPHLIPINSSSSSEDDADSQEPPVSIDGSSINTTKSSRSIQFDPSVTVIPVPSHRSYSPRMHAQLYTSRDTMSSDMMRNTREFIHEDWDWQKVIEEDGMYACKTSGELVHPAHVDFKRVNPYR